MRAPTPQHVRNGGAGDYRVLIGDYDANRRADVAIVSPNGGGAWNGWITVDLSHGDGFDFQARNAGTPIHMRNGLR